MRSWSRRTQHKLYALASCLSRGSKQVILLGFDLAALGTSLALALRSVPFAVGSTSRLLLLVGAPLLATCLFWAFGLYRSVVRSMGSHGPFAVGAVAIISAAALAICNRLVPGIYISADVIYRYCFFLLIFVGGGRLLARDILSRSIQHSQNGRVIVYGAGEAGRRLADALVSGPWKIVAFVDDNPQSHRASIRNLKVYAPTRLPALVTKFRVREVLLAMPSLSRRRRNEIINDLIPLGVAVHTVPDLIDIVTGAAAVDDVKDVNVADVLGRDPVPPVPQLLEACAHGRAVLVTGSGGSIGSELCRQIVRLGPRRLVLVERSELALYQVERELRIIATAHDLTIDIVPLLGDVYDKSRMVQVLRTYSIDTIYHAAAYKHVPIVERNVLEGAKNNVIGTWHMAEAAVASGVSTFILVSTDKAVNPTNVMGATKRMAEIVLQGLQQLSDKTCFCMVRFGNVLDSSGSVVPLFREQIRSGGPITVTHPEVTRYFMTIPEAVNLVLQAGAMSEGGDVFVLDMGSPVRIADLARRMVELSGLAVKDEETPDGDIEIRYTGLRPAEKLFEELVIGKSITGTRHPRILRAVEPALAWSVIEGLLKELLVALTQHDCGTALRVLRQAVAEYQPGEQPHDLVDRASGNTPRDHPRRAGEVAKVTQLSIHRN